MANQDNLSNIIERIRNGNQTEDDIEQLRQLLATLSDCQLASQLGKYNVNIEEGRDIHIGDLISNQLDKEVMEALVKAIQETSGIHQNTQSGDAAARDLHKNTNSETKTFIQILCPNINFNNSAQESLKGVESALARIPLESIQKACQKSLPQDARLWTSVDSHITIAKNKITDLLEEFRELPDFFKQLSQDENVPIDDRQQFQDLAIELASMYPKKHKNKSSTDFFSTKQEKLESYLLAVVEPSDKRFLLNAWLIVDDSLPVNNLHRFEPLLNDENQLGIFCQLNEIEERIDQFIEKSLSVLKFKPHSLTIELFLPDELLYKNIEWWNMSDFDYKKIPIGTRYPVRLRSIERLKERYLIYYLSQWIDNWNRVKKVLNNIPVKEQFVHLDIIKAEIFTLESLLGELDEKIGLKITCCPSENKRKDLLEAIIKAAIPIVFLTRCDLSNQNDKDEIDKLFNFQPLGKLCESIKIKRKEAYGQKANDEKEEHLGFHLALLWEDPHRLPPNVMLQLPTPGQ